MRVLNISSDDYANFAHDNAKALRSVGVKCIDLKTHPHSFNYPTQSEIASIADIKEAAKEADIVQIFHSDSRLLSEIKHLDKRIVVYHTGTRYRQNPERFNLKFNPYVETSIIALPEFAGLGAVNEQYFVGAVDVDAIKLKDRISLPYIVAHYPSSKETKGTNKILEMITKIDGLFHFQGSDTHVCFTEQLQRLNACDIYIELFSTQQNGKEYGSFGITALEAAALGKIVVTQNLHQNVYLDQYGYCPFVIANTENDFIEKMNALIRRTPEQIERLQSVHREWIIENHSHQATGARLKDILGI